MFCFVFFLLDTLEGDFYCLLNGDGERKFLPGNVSREHWLQLSLALIHPGGRHKQVSRERSFESLQGGREMDSSCIRA